ncbi:LysR substrate-binding domain-containing protein [Agrobacterium sp. rho-13.3]|uniref:LysR family transcriptional regulator n=1 Tax=Agrobacterium sp. rho-13.3 TaxID=3072980 RepID=UPI002A17F4A5|nr:LysR family transcriptional regulator [Agrobacterium sp. rho-13.3]MDX8306460.1 LysR family transcriptional regulator [Agrobacterium sp. rho-13.3]MDX8307209.1 LysR family transcriptional regulator [Agrobacterium sp. rho-13.3]
MQPDYLDTRQLEAFIAVMSIGSMTGAAKALGKSQPVITRLIQELEQELGFSILHRNGPRIAPTEQGVAFFAQAELFLGGLRTISQRARQIEKAQARPIEIAAIPALAASIVPLALCDLPQEQFPHHVHLHSAASENVVQAVVARTADVGVASLPLDNPGIDVHWIGEVPCVAVVADDDPLAHNDMLRASDLQGRRLIASANPYRLRMRIDKAMKEHAIEPCGVIDSNATYVSLSLARKGLGVAIVESTTIAGLPIDGLKVLPLEFHIPFYWGVITAIGVPLPTTVQMLIAAIERRAFDLPQFRKHVNLPSSY